MAIVDTITSMQTHTSNAYTMIGYGTDLTGTNKNLENLSTSIFNAFLEALRNPDTLFTNLPKVSGTGANITLNDTANAPMRITLGASELTQDGTPTPSSPQAVHTISGSNKVVVSDGNGNSQEADIDLDFEYCKIGNYEDKFIRTSGKNLLNRTTCTENYALVWADGTTYSQTNSLASDYIKINIGDKVKMNYSSQIMFYDSSKTYLGCLSSDGTSLIKTTGIETNSFTIPSGYNIAYMRLGFRTATNNNENMTAVNIMVNLGNTLLPYEPYGSNEWYIKKNIGKKVFNGTETFSNLTTRTNTTRFTYKITDKLINDTDTSMFYCDRGAGTPDYYWSRDEVGICELKNSTQASMIFSLPINEVYDNATAQTWFTNNNTTVYYVLATPTYTQITGTLETQLENVYQNLISYTGQTNISQENNDLSFELSVSALEDLG